MQERLVANKFTPPIGLVKRKLEVDLTYFIFAFAEGLARRDPPCYSSISFRDYIFLKLNA